MPTGHVFIATSLDGQIARADGRIDWLPGGEDMPDEDHGYDAFIAGMDAIVMGRESYETVLGFGAWPYTLPVAILSRTLTEVPAHAAGIAGSPEQAMDLAERSGWQHLYIDGGVTVQAFLARDLIADLVITRIPVLIGAGRPLFGALPADRKLRHMGTETYPSGLVQSRYQVIRPGIATT